MGWVQNHRDHGGCIFVDLRDRYGLTQVKFDPAVDVDIHKEADRLRSEWVIAVRGRVVDRGANENDKLATGAVEVEASHLEIFNAAKTPPFPISDRVEAEYLGEPRPEGLAARILSPSGGTVVHFDRFFLLL